MSNIKSGPLSIEEIPPNFATITEWKRRGYRVPRDAYPHCSYFGNLGNGNRWVELFKITQVDCIRGEKARIRRRAFHHHWLSATQKECS